jgi:hypothetical protein
MTLPSAQSIGKAVLMTAIAIAILKLAKPYVPVQLQTLLP